MTDSYAALREAAEKAQHSLENHPPRPSDDYFLPEEREFIVAARPDVVLGLLDNLDKAAARLKEAHYLYEENNKLQARVEELETQEADHLNVAVMLARRDYQDRIIALREMLASHQQNSSGYCPECAMYVAKDGHKPDCAWAALLETSA